jgi:Maleate cis-trans isomerase
VASACVQMPSLPAVQAIQDQTGIQTLSASVATTHQMMKTLGLETNIPGVGALFSN